MHWGISGSRSARSKPALRDGTLIEVPEDGPLPELDLKPALESNRKVTIFLGVPLLKSSHPNIAAEGPSDSARYYLITQQLDDENLGVNPQPITIRRLNLRLLLSTQDLAGYETIPLARIQKSDRAEATPQLDTSYIPPVLACDAWRELSVGILQQIYDSIGRKIETLTGQAVSRGISLDNLDRLSQEGVLNFAQLRVFNEAYAYLSNLAFVEGIHPLPVYLELCRLVGQLSIFHATRRPPDLPRYNHDDLADLLPPDQNAPGRANRHGPGSRLRGAAIRRSRLENASRHRAGLARSHPCRCTSP